MKTKLVQTLQTINDRKSGKDSIVHKKNVGFMLAETTDLDQRFKYGSLNQIENSTLFDLELSIIVTDIKGKFIALHEFDIPSKSIYNLEFQVIKEGRIYRLGHIWVSQNCEQRYWNMLNEEKL